jgi:hypothetical protein
MNIADEWIQHINDVGAGNEVGSEKDPFFDASSSLAKLCRTDPGQAWQIIKDIFSRSKTNELVLECLGAGPMEDLLSYNGEVVVDAAVEFCELHPEFKNVLEAVWQNSITDMVWRKIEACINS